MTRRAAGGFTLVEVLVALAVLVLVGGLVLQVFGGGLRNAEVADRMVRASALAESVLASVGADIPLAEGDASGTSADGFAWTVTIAPLPEPEQPSARAVLYTVTATVSWGARPNARSVTLTTLAIDVEP